MGQPCSHILGHCTGNLPCAIEKRVWISCNVQRRAYPRNEVGDHWSSSLRYPFLLLVKRLGDNDENECPGDERFWERQERGVRPEAWRLHGRLVERETGGIVGMVGN